MDNQRPDLFSEAMITLRGANSDARRQLTVQLDPDDPDPALTIGKAVEELAKTPEWPTGPEDVHALRPMKTVAQMDDKETCRSVFEMLHQHLDLERVLDAWQRPVYKHSHVQALFEGWSIAVHAFMKLSDTITMYTMAAKMAEIRNSLGYKEYMSLMFATPTRGNSPHVVHLDDSGYLAEKGVVEQSAAAGMSAQELFNLGNRIGPTKLEQIHLPIDRPKPPANLRYNSKLAEETWPGSWATLRQVAQLYIEKMGLRRYSCFEHEDGIYERSDGSYIDIMDLINFVEDKIALVHLKARPSATGTFRVGQFLRHYKGGLYFVVGEPTSIKIESNGQPAYAYVDMEGKVWIREMLEMEGDATQEGVPVPRFSTVPLGEVTPEEYAKLEKYLTGEVYASMTTALVFDAVKNLQA